MKRRVVITGMGAVSPLGNDLRSLASGLREGRCPEAPITRFRIKDFPVRNAFEVKGFNPHEFGTHLLDPFIQYAVGAADQAVKQSQVDWECIDLQRVGISVSSSKGGMHTLDRFKERLRSRPSAVLGARVYTSSVPNFAAQWIARRWKIKGAAKCYIAACATGTVSIIEGARMVEEGMVDFCIAGASDASIVPLMLAGYSNMKVMPSSGMFPFDRRRKGFLAGEGAGMVFLETYESARSRGAEICGEIAGFEYGCDSYDGIHFDEGQDALSRTLKGALGRALLAPEEIDYINLHGTGTPAGDLYETRQIKHAFGEGAYGIPMSSTKSMTGHMLGASGAVEIVTILTCFKHGFLPPTVNLEIPGEECDLDYVAQASRPSPGLATALSVSMGFGGHIAVIALKKGS